MLLSLACWTTLGRGARIQRHVEAAWWWRIGEGGEDGMDGF